MADEKANEAGQPPFHKIERKPVGSSTSSPGSAPKSVPATEDEYGLDESPPAYRESEGRNVVVTTDRKESTSAQSTTAGPPAATSTSSQSVRERSRTITPPTSIHIDKTKPEDFDGEMATNNELPSPELIKKIDDYIVLDKDGKSHTFKTLYSGTNVARRVLIIFVRHFFCGV
jgi:hypothetical protein